MHREDAGCQLIGIELYGFVQLFFCKDVVNRLFLIVFVMEVFLFEKGQGCNEIVPQRHRILFAAVVTADDLFDRSILIKVTGITGDRLAFAGFETGV